MRPLLYGALICHGFATRGIEPLHRLALGLVRLDVEAKVITGRGETAKDDETRLIPISRRLAGYLAIGVPMPLATTSRPHTDIRACISRRTRTQRGSPLKHFASLSCWLGLEPDLESLDMRWAQQNPACTQATIGAN